jgi:hypothetical protein
MIHTPAPVSVFRETVVGCLVQHRSRYSSHSFRISFRGTITHVRYGATPRHRHAMRDVCFGEEFNDRLRK